MVCLYTYKGLFSGRGGFTAGLHKNMKEERTCEEWEQTPGRERETSGGMETWGGLKITVELFKKIKQELTLLRLFAWLDVSRRVSSKRPEHCSGSAAVTGSPQPLRGVTHRIASLARGRAAVSAGRCFRKGLLERS